MIKKNLCFLLLLFGAAALPASAQCTDAAVNQQRAAFTTLTSIEKAEMWKSHLRTELTNRKLNKAQRDTIEKAIEIVSPEFYEAKGAFGKALARTLDDLRHQMKANFSAVEGQEIFERVGEYKPTTDAAKLASFPDCNCSTLWTWCTYGQCRTVPNQYCIFDACTMVINCGPFWGFQCNGMCCGPSNEERPSSGEKTS